MKREALTATEGFIQTLQSQLLFVDIPRERLELLVQKAQNVHMLKEEVIFRKGESYHKGIYLVLSGKISMQKETGDIIMISTGELAGLANFLGKSTYIVTARAMTDAELLFLPEICIYKLMEDFSDFRDKFYRFALERLTILSGGDHANFISSTFKAVGSYMNTPVVTIASGKTVSDAATLMADSSIGSLAVVDKKGALKGILTVTHLVHSFLAKLEQNRDKQLVDDHMETNPLTFPQEFPLVEALSEMQSRGIGYALVTRSSRPIGIISDKDIIKVLFRNITIFSTHVDMVDTLDELRQAHRDLHTVAENLVAHTRLSHEILPVISTIHLTIQKKTFRVSAGRFAKDTGFDVNSVRHASVIMGSGGRKEMMLDPDQDHGVILPDGTPQEIIDTFVAFGAYFADDLEYVGYEKCRGNVMISNPAMTKTLHQWKADIAEWVSKPAGMAAVWSSIIFDFDIFEGDETLVWELREFILRKVEERPVFIIQMLENDLNLKIPVSLFGKFITEKEGSHKDSINMKSSALAFIVNIARAFSLHSGITDINTVERLNHLQRKKVLSEETVMQAINAYESLVDIVLNEQVDAARAGYPVNKYVNPHKLSLHNQERLKRALHYISKLQNTSLRYFKGHP